MIHVDNIRLVVEEDESVDLVGSFTTCVRRKSRSSYFKRFYCVDVVTVEDTSMLI